MKKNLVVIVLGAISVLGLGACGTQTVITETAQAISEDRLTEEQIVDNKIKFAALDRLAEHDKGLLLDLNIDVWKNTLMVTGTLDSTTTRNTVIRIIREDNRVKQLHNDIQIVSTQEKETRRTLREKAEAGATAAGNSISDFWIEAKIKGTLLVTKDVSSANYRFRSVLGGVYLLGEAASSTELATVLREIKSINGVKGVKSHVFVSPR